MDDSTAPLPSDPRDELIAKQAAIIAGLEARIRELQAIIDQLNRGAKRQSAPFSKGTPKSNPKKPGRKPGSDYGTPPAFRAMPEPSPADQVIDVPAPDVCPGCGDRSAGVESIDEQVQRDIEVRTVIRRFKIKVCKCGKCGRIRRGKHPLQTSSATGCCASQVGPLARSAMAFMNKSLGLSMGKIASLFTTLWDLHITRGGVCNAIVSLGDKCRNAYRSILQAVRDASEVTPDETGWRVGGLRVWLHAAAAKDAVAYAIDPARGKQATDRLIGQDYRGTMTHDGWSPYDRYTSATHQQCLAHLIRRCSEMLEIARGGAVIFPRKIKKILQHALTLRNQRNEGKRSLRSTRIHAGKLKKQIHIQCKTRKSNRANQRMARFLKRHADELFTFLRRENVDATNWRGEHAIRGAVVNRKVWGGNRTWRGAETQMVLMSVINTLHLRGISKIEWLQKIALNQNPPMLA